MVECRTSESGAVTRQQQSVSEVVQECDFSPMVQRNKSEQRLDYDRNVFIANPFKAEKEEDDFKDSIAFYYPPTELEDDKINLCGQISGLYKMLLAFPGAPPDFISTHTRGYAVRTLGERFIIAMHSRTLELPAYTIDLLEQLHRVICFYHHSPEKMLERAKGNWNDLAHQLSAAMPLYMRYVLLRCQSKMTSIFHCIPYLLSSPGKAESRLMLQASQLLQWCRGSTYVFSGCITHRSRVICSHLPLNLCHHLLILVQDESKLLSVLDTAGPTDVDGLPVHLFPVYLTQEELALVAPPTRPDLSQTYRRLRRVSAHTTTHPARQSRRGGQRPSHVGSGERGGQGVAVKHGLSEGITGRSLGSSQPRYKVVHTTPGPGSSHVTGGQQEDTAHPMCNVNQPSNAVEDDLETLGDSHIKGDPPQVVKTSPTPSPSTTIGHSPPITISQRAESTPPSCLTVSASPATKSSHSGSGSFVTPGHSSPDNLDHQNILPSSDISPDGFVFKTPQSSVSESRALFPQQDSSPLAGQAGGRKEQDGAHDSLQEVLSSEHTDKHRPEDRGKPQEDHLTQCSVLMLRCFDTAVILLGSNELAESTSEVVRIWETVYPHLNSINAAVKLFQLETAPDNSRQADGMAVSVSYCGADGRLDTATPLTSYFHRQCIKLMHTEFASDPSLIQGTLHEGKHCRMFGQRLGGHESYLQPSEKLANRWNATAKHQSSWQQHDLPELAAHQLHKGDSGGKHPPFL